MHKDIDKPTKSFLMKNSGIECVKICLKYKKYNDRPCKLSHPKGI